jgi:hypothetical protein
VLRELSHLSNQGYLADGDIDKTIEMPTELNGLFSGLVRTAFQKRYNVAILAWVTYARSPIDIRQLGTAAAVTEGDGVTSWIDCCRKRPILKGDTIRKHLGTLVDVIDDRLYLIHQSLRDFLTRPGTDIWRQPDVSLSIPHPELALGKACMTFLSFDDFEATSRDGHKVEKLNNDPFLSYASDFWYEHIDKAEDVKEDGVKLHRILRGPNRRLWIETGKMQNEQSLCNIAIHYDMGWLASLLLNQISSDLSETFKDDCLVQAAASGPRVLYALLEHATIKQIRVTGKVVKAAAGNWRNGKEVMALLLDQRGPEVKITEDVVKEAASNESTD